jgi:O-antigen ligase
MALVVGQGMKNDWFMRVTRSYSLKGLNGRSYLWDQAQKGIGESPLIGFGLSMGATGMPENKLSDAWTSSEVSDPAQLSRVTFHNGYVQSVMDSGVLGTFFYIATMMVALFRLIADARKEYAPAFYAIVFLCVSNLGESVIYSAAMFPSLFFWSCAVFAMSLRRDEKNFSTASVIEVTDSSIRTGSLYPNLLR